jgi:Fe-Mn family superoxide dismutase
MAPKQYQLPDLPYDLGALAPAISGEIMELHYKKHHAAYVANLNKALEQYSEAESKGDVAKQIQLQSAIRFNGGGNINHSIFWTNLAPVNQGGGTPPEGKLLAEIEKTFGSLQNFIDVFSAKTVAIQGSGWGWLAYDPDRKRIGIYTCANQDPLAINNRIPLLGIDVWEHAYYLQYKNVRADYVKAIWSIVNWKNVAERYEAATKG